ncbi:MAG: GMC family oxidoreductase [Pirellulaceae bacterium]
MRYIIIGGGTAGCWLARQLASQQTGQVALLEAGPPTSDVRTVVPCYYPKLFGSKLDWGWRTQPQPSLAGRQISWPRGRLLGGSGAINALIHLQAADGDFARWGWEWASDCRQRLEQVCETPETLVEPHPWSQVFLRAAGEAGLSITMPLVQSAPNRCGLLSLSSRGGRRVQPSQGLAAIDNLSLVTGCQVQRIVTRAGQARGVDYLDTAGQLCHLQSDEEIILCAGAIGSPVLLFQSGIGPRAVLASVGIPCDHELTAVGRNLQDHLVYPVTFATRDSRGLPRRHNRDSRLKYRSTGAGNMASNIAEAAAFSARGVSGSSSTDCSDFQIHFTPTHYLKYPRIATEHNHLSLAVTDLHPHSRGSITAAKSTDGSLRPAIDPAYLHEARDVDRFLDGIAWARSIASQPSFKRLISEELLPGAKRQEPGAIVKSLSMFAQSIYHPVGTCRMQSSVDGAANATVVDREFRVHGVDNLRVVDASVLPDLPSGNTNVVVMLIAQHAAELILRKTSIGEPG